MTTAFRFLCLPPIPEVPEPLRATPVVNVVGAFEGDPAEGARLIDKLRAVAPPMMDAFATMPAAGLCHINGDPEQPTPGMIHQTMIRELTDDAIAALLETAGPGSESPLLAVSLRHLGGALATAPDGAGCLDALEGEFAMYGVGVPFAPEMAGPIATHLDKVVDAVAPWSTGVDYLNLAERPSDSSKAFAPDVYASCSRSGTLSIRTASSWRATRCAERRGWDSNPRDRSPGLLVFKTSAFNRSATPPGRSW